MPLADVGSLILSHAVFIIHLGHLYILFSDVDPGLSLTIYLLVKLLATRPEELHGGSGWLPLTQPAAPR
jgi:hypothetical protein